jgi:hypothetical protein
MDNMEPANKKKTGKFKPGISGNPNGRPKIPEDIKDACKAASIEAISILLSLMRSEDTNAGERIKAATTILNRAWGTPAQSVEINNSNSEPFRMIIEYVSKKE